MSMKKWLPFMLAAGVVLGVLSYWFHTRTYEARELVEMLPPDRASYVFLDLDMLRAADLLDQIAGSPAIETDEYKSFVNATGFNYRTDLDAVAIAFRDGDNYFVAQGRFDWGKITSDAQLSGGTCVNEQCQVPSSVPGKMVTMYMPRADVLAIASSRNQPANAMIAPGTWENSPKIPEGSVLWALMPPFAFTEVEGDLPSGTRSYLSPIKDSEGATFSLGPSEDLQSFVLKMVVQWPDEAAAKKAAEDLTKDTELLNSMIERQNMTPSPADLSGVLTEGKFTVEDTTMVGTWPIQRVLFDSMFAPAGPVEQEIESELNESGKAGAGEAEEGSSK